LQSSILGCYKRSLFCVPLNTEASEAREALRGEELDVEMTLRSQEPVVEGTLGVISAAARQEAARPSLCQKAAVAASARRAGRRTTRKAASFRSRRVGLFVTASGDSSESL